MENAEDVNKAAGAPSGLNDGLGDANARPLEMIGKLAHALMHANQKSVCGAAPNGRYINVLNEYETFRISVTKSPNVEVRGGSDSDRPA